MSSRKSDTETPRNTFSNRTHAPPSTPGRSKELMLTPCSSLHVHICPVEGIGYTRFSDCL